VRRWRWLPGPLVTALVAGLAPPAALACAVCTGSPEAAETQGVRAGVLLLLGVVGLVQIGFTSLFVAIWRRSRRLSGRQSFNQLHAGEGR